MKHIIIRPHRTEKSFALAAAGYYTFAVAGDAAKKTIGQAIADFYHVHVVDVRTAFMPGKTKRAGGRQTRGATSSWKKAMVRLSAGEKIDAFEIPKDKTTDAKKET